MRRRGARNRTGLGPGSGPGSGRDRDRDRLDFPGLPRLRAFGAIALFGLLGAAGLGVACSLAFPLDSYGPGTRPDAALSDGASDGQIADAGREAGCPLDRWPNRPAADDPGGSDLALVFAVTGIDLGLGDAGAPPPGYDLDGLCTCPDPSPCTGAGPMCDRDGGVDNGVSDLLYHLSSFGQLINQQRTNANIAKGLETVLVVLHGYNGLPNDTNVQIAIFRSDGTPPVDDAGNTAHPQLDGTDVWTVDRSSVVGESGPPILPKFVDQTGYVADGVLVGHVEFPLSLGGGSNVVAVDLQEGIVAARVVHDSLWRLASGRIAGRWTTTKLLTALSAVADPFGTGNLCADSGTYQALKPQICAAADIMGGTVLDGTGQKCDALSLGIGFEAVQAQMGNLGPARDAGSPCGVGYRDDCPR